MPPQNTLDQIKGINTSHRLGRLLCISQKPDFLLDMIQRQQKTSLQSMPWLADFVQNSEGSLNQLPVQCLCKYLLLTAMQPQFDKQSKQQQLLDGVIDNLQMLLTDPNQDQHYAEEVLEYILRRLSSQQSSSRNQAITGLKLVLNSVPSNDEIMEIDGDGENGIWLLRQLPSIPYFHTVKALLATTLRDACQVENNPDLVRAYITYFPLHTSDDKLTELFCIVNEISQLVVERNIMAAILPHSYNDTVQARQTLNAFMFIYCNYFKKANSPREGSRVFTWSKSQDLILVEMHILVVHAMIILFPERNEPLKAFLVDESEEALLIPDWLRLHIIRSKIPQLVNTALKDLEPYQLFLFIKSFGVPVDAKTKLLRLLHHAVVIDAESVGAVFLDKTYMTQLVNILDNRGTTEDVVMEKLELQVEQSPQPNDAKMENILQDLPFNSTVKKSFVSQVTSKADVPYLINRLFIENIDKHLKLEANRRLNKILAKVVCKTGKELYSSAVVLFIKHICSILSLTPQFEQFLAFLINLTFKPLKILSTPKQIIKLAVDMCDSLMALIGSDVNSPILSILKDFTYFHAQKESRQKIQNSDPCDPELIL